MKAAGSDPSHHEAIPRREKRIGQRPARVFVSDNFVLNFYEFPKKLTPFRQKGVFYETDVMSKTVVTVLM